MESVRKSQLAKGGGANDKNLKILREFVSTGGNRQCFDCGQRGPTYINMTIGSFVCTQCSGILRGLTPPHRVKSISMATFSQDEIDFVRAHGNEECTKTWLGLCDISDPKRPKPQQDHRELMVDKYERKRYYLEPASPLKSIAAAAATANSFSSGTAVAAASPTPVSSMAAQANNLAILKGISLTPPTKSKTSGHRNQQQQQNGNNKNHTNSDGGSGITALPLDNSSSGGFNQPFHSLFKQQQQNRPTIQNIVNNNFHINNNNNVTNSSSASSKSFATMPNGANKNHHHLQQQQQKPFSANNEDDFVADFSKADIFANVQSTTNGNFQPAANLMMNGNAAPTENFADFEHNPIFNAIGLPMSISSSNSTTSSLGPGTAFPSNSSINAAPSADRYAALKDLDEQLREFKEKEQQQHPHQSPQQPANANPFKMASGGTTTNPFKMQQQLQVETPINGNFADFGSGTFKSTNGDAFMAQGFFNAFPINHNVLANGNYGHSGVVTAPSKSNNPFL